MSEMQVPPAAARMHAMLWVGTHTAIPSSSVQRIQPRTSGG
jgi:hypothetical protein